VSYGMPILLKLIFARDNFPITAMSLGPYSNICGVFSCMWLFGTSTLLFLPPVSPVDPTTMNWTVVVVAGFAVISIIFWFAYAGANFRGPARNENDAKFEVN